MKKDVKYALGSFILGSLSIFIYNLTVLKARAIYFFKVLAMVFVVVMIFFLAKIVIRWLSNAMKNKAGS